MYLTAFDIFFMLMTVSLNLKIKKTKSYSGIEKFVKGAFHELMTTSCEQFTVKLYS